MVGWLVLGEIAVAGETRTMRAELDVYSGRPNPAWDLTDAQSQEFLQRLLGLPRAEVCTIPDGLGYRGIILTGAGRPIAGFDRLVISHGVVLGHGPGGDQCFRDQDRALERWLFHTAKGNVDKYLYDHIDKGLGVP